MDALAALSALHYLAGKITALPNKTERLLDMKNWSSDETLIRTFEDPRAVPPFRIWQSLLFKIRTVYLPDDL